MDRALPRGSNLVAMLMEAKGRHHCKPLFIWRARQDKSGHWLEVLAVD